MYLKCIDKLLSYMFWRSGDFPLVGGLDIFREVPNIFYMQDMLVFGYKSLPL